METSKILIGYFIYLPITILLTLYVSRILFKNGKLFMIDIFKGKEEIALATNQLFKVGFYLLNIGFALMIMEIHSYGFNDTYQSLVEILSSKIGGFTIYLGIMLFFNLFLFFRGRKKSRQSRNAQLS
ncbi:MAG: hypothetical protein CMF34_13620 [Leeuwenhoekiella sp.]|uniref:hypothetical protein n=1 Tax=unclassified Leeuwenhoekiella TaxID=2615029 RepID=UPI000C39E815|nr:MULTISPECIES: hypothetical protein [unclassified Leeuwenhoekiella]MAS21271.1 hypothetical protein [Leeuwenhoekiella sp.]MAW93911.1 hypothetical protein [Leeuwenhoekiella sp.]MBA81675.1 hypothetical protein [Leeuwenhoekiella sp.]|tara:strand:+ start:28149 stop:28529 length:381 start_codon:yes stop_codon:yes gene_type:complete